MILLDSSVLIDLFRKKKKENSYFYKNLFEFEDFAISTITHYEIGIGNSSTFPDYWKTLTDNLSVLPLDKKCAEVAIDIYLELKRKSKLIDLADILIASTAISNSVPLATLNKKHFTRISDLEIL